MQKTHQHVIVLMCFPYLVTRALGEKFIEIKPDKPQIFCIWGHSYEMDYGADYWVKLEEFFKLISGKENIFNGTNKEVLLSY